MATATRFEPTPAGDEDELNDEHDAEIVAGRFREWPDMGALPVEIASTLTP